jgi:GNAT superfamily N-acetyltransferase
MKDAFLEIVPLAGRPDLVPILAWWSFMEWYRARNIGFDTLLASYRERAARDDGTGFLVACSGSVPVGMVSLKMNDLWSRPDLNPWLASLYVCPEYRCRNIGTGLIDKLFETARGRGFGRVYIYLARNNREKLEAFYRKRGWLFHDEAVDNDGLSTLILSYDL